MRHRNFAGSEGAHVYFAYGCVFGVQTVPLDTSIQTSRRTSERRSQRGVFHVNHFRLYEGVGLRNREDKGLVISCVDLNSDRMDPGNTIYLIHVLKNPK